MNKGLRACIYQNPQGNFSNNGISAKVKEVTIVGLGIPEIFPVTDNAPAVRVVKRTIAGKPYVHAEPVDQPEGVLGPMASGAFIYSNDSRFADAVGHSQPISLHDRFETQAQYNALSV